MLNYQLTRQINNHLLNTLFTSSPTPIYHLRRRESVTHNSKQIVPRPLKQIQLFNNLDLVHHHLLAHQTRHVRSVLVAFGGGLREQVHDYFAELADTIAVVTRICAGFAQCGGASAEADFAGPDLWLLGGSVIVVPAGGFGRVG